MLFRLVICGSESMITWQYSRAMVPPQTMQRFSPRNTSLWSIPVLNAVVVDIFDISRSSQPYPRGGAFGVRGTRTYP